MFFFIPDPLENDPIWLIFFKNGWLNHQPVISHVISHESISGNQPDWKNQIWTILDLNSMGTNQIWTILDLNSMGTNQIWTILDLNSMGTNQIWTI